MGLCDQGMWCDVSEIKLHIKNFSCLDASLKVSIIQRLGLCVSRLSKTPFHDEHIMSCATYPSPLFPVVYIMKFSDRCDIYAIVRILDQKYQHGKLTLILKMIWLHFANNHIMCAIVFSYCLLVGILWRNICWNCLIFWLINARFCNMRQWKVRDIRKNVAWCPFQMIFSCDVENQVTI